MEENNLSNVNMDLICRFCLNSPSDPECLHSIFDDEENEKLIELIIKTNLNISLVPFLPNKICESCKSVLEQFNWFLEQIANNEAVLLNLNHHQDQELEQYPDEDDKNLKLELFVCHFCSLSFEDEDIFNEHSQSCNENTSENSVCFEEADEENTSLIITADKEEHIIVVGVQENDEHCETKQVCPASSVCNFCGVPWSSKSDHEMVLHFLKHIVELSSQDSRVTHRSFCHICGLIVTSSESLNEHCLEKHDSVPLVTMKWDLFPDTNFTNTVNHYECLICETLKPQKESLVEHALGHFAERNVCIKCDNHYISKLSLNEHQKHHEEYKFSCHVCDKVFTSKSALNGHLERHVAASSLIDNLCHICGKSFATTKLLAQHQSTHVHCSTLICSICGYKSLRRGDMNMHQRVHSGKRPYECTYENCGKKYKNASHLSAHLKTHLNLRNHSCPLCELTFFRSTALKTHMLRHTGEKPYLCSVCNAKFSKKYNCKMHMTKMHGMESDSAG